MFCRNGSALIAAALSRFESLARQLDRGVALNRKRHAKNDAEIMRLYDDNALLTYQAEHGERVAAKLRELVS